MKGGQVRKKFWIRFLTQAELLRSGHYRWRSKSPRIYLVFGQTKIPLSWEECCMRVFSLFGNTWRVPCCFCSIKKVTCSYWLCCPWSMALMLWFRVVGSQCSGGLTGQGWTHYMWAWGRLEPVHPAAPGLFLWDAADASPLETPSVPAQEAACRSLPLSWRPAEARHGLSYSTWWSGLKTLPNTSNHQVWK